MADMLEEFITEEQRSVVRFFFAGKRTEYKGYS
jgi:hypothetical protein